MAWLFPHRFGSDVDRRLDAALAERHLATEALSQSAKDVKDAAEADQDRARQIVADVRARIAKQEERRLQSRADTLGDLLARRL